ncbi:hypothetical protein DFS33DRAFT_598435 [Desarmillaria ectypa]|nr:hypothetical protein DFS33DRAFT_598435 [Desarmillaria ectypa]
MIAFILLVCTLESTFAHKMFLCTSCSLCSRTARTRSHAVGRFFVSVLEVFATDDEFYYCRGHVQVLFDASREGKKQYTFQVLHSYSFATVIPRN